MAARKAKARGWTKAKGAARRPGGGGAVSILVGTRKGAFRLRSDAARRTWKLEGPWFLGSLVHHVVADPREPRAILMAARTGHLGPTIFRSTDGGRSWKEAAKPPAFPGPAVGGRERAVDHTFWLTPGHASEPGTWYAGSSPPGLFRSGDGGATWESVAGFNDHPRWDEWTMQGRDGTPDGSKMHSILVDPRDGGHLYLAMSSGGVFESVDRGASWRPLNKGVVAEFLPVKDPEFGHDPHCVVQHPLRPDRLYQQNHCGFYRIDRPAETWERVGDNLPRAVGDVGFPVVVHPRDPDAAWMIPMDGTRVWPRTSVGGKPAVMATRNGGRTWRRLDRGFPRKQAWWTVKRQAFCGDGRDPQGLYLGTTNGEIWASRDEGASWACIARHLPHVYSVTPGAGR
jgi:photosystem II stability/assembly factor-like uncharacterized protein